ncbi:MAG: sensor domain-containing diguanylate cyclase [Lachnospiraceae bacterium]|nr:sensor domain-containing diguanylate cyclase [Lachnospiraceae bacterium]
MNEEKQMLEDIFDYSDMLYNKMRESNAGDYLTLYNLVTELGKLLCNADRASFWQWDKEKKVLWTISATEIDRIEIPDDTGLVGKALKERKVVVTNDPYNDPNFNKEVDIKTGYTTKNIMVMPVADLNGNYIGAFQIINKLDGTDMDEKEDARKLSLATILCGMALESEKFLSDALHDKLTTLKNRMGFFSDYAKIKDVYKAGVSDYKLSLFICDIDKFKRVNDVYGHNAGDEVLKFVAKTISNSLEEPATAYRWGGEEFVVILPNADLDECAAKAEEIRKKLENSACNVNGISIPVTMSFGCVEFDKEKSIEENIEKADNNLYQAKETGRNKVVR